VQSLLVVEHVDVIEHFAARFIAGLEALVVRQFPPERTEVVFHHPAIVRLPGRSAAAHWRLSGNVARMAGAQSSCSFLFNFFESSIPVRHAQGCYRTPLYLTLKNSRYFMFL
jgi:hypothetical protein